jgi:hypothetical protein
MVVRTRVEDHPTSAIDELLPGAWAATRMAPDHRS